MSAKQLTPKEIRDIVDLAVGSGHNNIRGIALLMDVTVRTARRRLAQLMGDEVYDLVEYNGHYYIRGVHA